MKKPLNFRKFIKNKLFQRITIGLLLFIPFCLMFVAGSFSTASQTEVCAEFFTTLTKKHTSGKTYSTLVVEEFDGSHKKLLPTENEFYRLYGSFRQDKACFANTYNINKENNIELNGTAINRLSLLFTSAGLNLEYDAETGWRHEFYPLRMMYNAPKEERPSTSGGYCFISQTQADALLRSNFIGHIPSEPFTLEDYKELQYKVITLSNEENSYKYCILSIFYEVGYYVDALKEIMGDFTFVYGKTPGNLNKQATYFMRDYTFQNEYYINYVKKQYAKDDFNYKIGKYNVVDDFADKINLSEYIFGIKNDALAITLFVVAFILISCLIALLFLSNFGSSWIDILLFVLASFMPFLIFKLIATVTESSKWFTAISTQFNMWTLIAVICLFCIAIFISHSRKRVKSDE